jgi:hypothetical protein
MATAWRGFDTAGIWITHSGGWFGATLKQNGTTTRRLRYQSLTRNALHLQVL